MVAAIVGIRKAMDYFPNIFTQRELSWLDDVIPDEQKEWLKFRPLATFNVDDDVISMFVASYIASQLSVSQVGHQHLKLRHQHRTVYFNHIKDQK